jgi:outer membrane protein OmpA-like peptidoglycan-associated protein
MAEDWAADVKRYEPDADDSVIAGIVRHCGIALQSRDASLVSFTDPAETDRVRENFLKKKLGLTLPDEELDAAIARVGERMSDDPTRNRVTVYYLLAQMFGKLHLFGSPAAAATVAADEPPAEPVRVAADPPPPPPPRVDPAPAYRAAAAAPVAAAAAHEGRRRGGAGILGTALLALGAMGLIILVAATAGSLIGGGRSERTAPAPAVVDAAPAVVATPAPAPAPVPPAIPEGMGVLAEEVDGRPKLSVYFDTAKADVAPDFATVAAPIKAYVDANPGARLAVSGYNDPRGDPAFNAELSKNRAQNVKAALVALGVPEGVIDLEKPAETTDATTTFENARRVDIMVKDAG